jgi:pantoate--beta-alanine ligase
LYAPEASRMYPEGFATRIDAGPIGSAFEGAARPGHFAGVATVVVKLLHAIEPTSLYLGQKDVQQLAVLRTIVRELDMAVSVIAHPTVRESDGLALSSRNVYLTPAHRAAAPGFYRGLRAAAAAIAAGESDRERILGIAASFIEEPLALEYLDMVDPFTFAPLPQAQRPALLVGAVRAGDTRLLDNLPIASADGVDPVLTPLRSPAVRAR